MIEGHSRSSICIPVPPFCFGRYRLNPARLIFPAGMPLDAGPVWRSTANPVPPAPAMSHPPPAMLRSAARAATQVDFSKEVKDFIELVAVRRVVAG
jgi:hypothetical protein